MNTQLMTHFVGALGTARAVNFLGTIIFIKWALKEKPDTMAQCEIYSLKIIADPSGIDGDMIWRTLSKKLERIEGEYAELFKWLDCSDPLPILGLDSSLYVSMIEAVAASDLDERSLLAQLSSQVDSGAVETPASIAALIGKLAASQAGDSILDPVCGSASLLTACAVRGARITGLERNQSLWFLAKLNVIFSGYSSESIYNSDCLIDPPESSDKYDVVVGNPPWGLRLESRAAALVESGEIWFEANPKTFLDYAFVLEMIRRMRPLTGRVAVLVSNGMLTRPGPEAEVRRQLVERNLLEAVIGLPDKMFANSSIGSSILMFKMDRASKDILFVDARGYATLSRGQNSFSDHAVGEISTLVKDARTLEGVSRMVTPEEVATQEFSINVPRYIDSAPKTTDLTDEMMPRHKEALQNELERLSQQIQALSEKLKRH